MSGSATDNTSIAKPVLKSPTGQVIRPQLMLEKLLIERDKAYRQSSEFKAPDTKKTAEKRQAEEELLRSIDDPKLYMKQLGFISKAPPRENILGRYCEKCHQRTVIKSKIQVRAGDEGENEKFQCQNPQCRNIIIR